MFWYKVIRVKLNERVVVFDDGVPMRALGPGKHRIWGSRLSEQRFVTDTLTFDALPEVRAMLDATWFREVTLSRMQRAVLSRDGRAVSYLRPGTHRYWVVDPSVELAILDLGAPLPPLDDELLRLMPAGDFTRRTVEAHEAGLLIAAGQVVKLLGPGQHAFWSTSEAPARIATIDMRSQQATLAPQELMTRDKVTLRLTLSIEYRVSEPIVAFTRISDVRDALYLATQLAARDFVAAHTLDQLLEGRDELGRHLSTEVVAAASEFGVEVKRVGAKDVVLPGEMKTLLNRVIEAEKAAAANVITRREEAAATRLLASTARIMEEQPLLMRLKELETLKEMASSVDELRVVVGDRGFDKLLKPDLFAPRA